MMKREPFERDCDEVYAEAERLAALGDSLIQRAADLRQHLDKNQEHRLAMIASLATCEKPG